MRRLITSFALATFFLTGCAVKEKCVGQWHQQIDSEEVTTIVQNFSAKMKSEQHLILDDSRVSYDKFINRIYLEYHTQRLIDLCEARNMMVDMVDDLLERINKNTILSFQLERFPFTAEDIDIKVTFTSFYGMYIDKELIGQIFLQCGCVHYYAFDRRDFALDYSHHRFEPYFKAREITLAKRKAEIPYSENGDPSKPKTLIYERYLETVP